MKKIKTRNRECYIERGWYNGTVYRYVDSVTKVSSREYNWEEQCIDEAMKAGYRIVRRNEPKR